jgi:hypothetical protein
MEHPTTTRSIKKHNKTIVKTKLLTKPIFSQFSALGKHLQKTEGNMPRIQELEGLRLDRNDKEPKETARKRSRKRWLNQNHVWDAATPTPSVNGKLALDCLQSGVTCEHCHRAATAFYGRTSGESRFNVSAIEESIVRRHQLLLRAVPPFLADDDPHRYSRRGKGAPKSCPVAREKCVSCHMPKTKVNTPGGLLTFSDHQIRIVKAREAYPN